MEPGESEQSTHPLGLGVWLRAIASGLVVMVGVMFVCVMLPFAFQLGVLGVVVFAWLIISVGVLLGVALGILTVRQTLRLARREREEAARKAGPQ